MCQITQTPFHTTKQIHSLRPKTVCGLRNSCLSKSSVLNLNIGLPDPLTWGQLLTRSLHFEKHWSFFSSCRYHPKLALIKTLCVPQNLVSMCFKGRPFQLFLLDMLHSDKDTKSNSLNRWMAWGIWRPGGIIFVLKSDCRLLPKTERLLFEVEMLIIMWIANSGMLWLRLKSACFWQNVPILMNSAKHCAYLWFPIRMYVN